MPKENTETLRNEKINENATVSIIRSGNTRFNVNSIYDAEVSLDELLLSLAEEELAGGENLANKISDGRADLSYNYSGD